MLPFSPHRLLAGVFSMCRKKTMQGCCCSCFGIGLIVGYALESWLLCSAGGLALIFFGLLLMKGR